MFEIPVQDERTFYNLLESRIARADRFEAAVQHDGRLQLRQDFVHEARHVPRFMDEILPKLKAPIVLHSGFETVSTRYPGFEKIIKSPLILHWYLEHFELDRE